MAKLKKLIASSIIFTFIVTNIVCPLDVAYASKGQFCLRRVRDGDLGPSRPSDGKDGKAPSIESVFHRVDARSGESADVDPEQIAAWIKNGDITIKMLTEMKPDTFLQRCSEEVVETLGNEYPKASDEEKVHILNFFAAGLEKLEGVNDTEDIVETLIGTITMCLLASQRELNNLLSTAIEMYAFRVAAIINNAIKQDPTFLVKRKKPPRAPTPAAQRIRADEGEVPGSGATVAKSQPRAVTEQVGAPKELSAEGEIGGEVVGRLAEVKAPEELSSPTRRPRGQGSRKAGEASASEGPKRLKQQPVAQRTEPGERSVDEIIEKIIAEVNRVLEGCRERGIEEECVITIAGQIRMSNFFMKGSDIKRWFWRNFRLDVDWLYEEPQIPVNLYGYSIEQRERFFSNLRKALAFIITNTATPTTLDTIAENPFETDMREILVNLRASEAYKLYNALLRLSSAETQVAEERGYGVSMQRLSLSEITAAQVRKGTTLLVAKILERERMVDTEKRQAELVEAAMARAKELRREALIAPLLLWLDDEIFGDSACQALVDIGNKAVPYLKRVVKSPYVAQLARNNANMALGWIAAREKARPAGGGGEPSLPRVEQRSGTQAQRQAEIAMGLVDGERESHLLPSPNGAVKFARLLREATSNKANSSFQASKTNFRIAFLDKSGNLTETSCNITLAMLESLLLPKEQWTMSQALDKAARDTIKEIRRQTGRRLKDCNFIFTSGDSYTEDGIQYSQFKITLKPKSPRQPTMAARQYVPPSSPSSSERSDEDVVESILNGELLPMLVTLRGNDLVQYANREILDLLRGRVKYADKVQLENLTEYLEILIKRIIIRNDLLEMHSLINVLSDEVDEARERLGMPSELERMEQKVQQRRGEPPSFEEIQNLISGLIGPNAEDVKIHLKAIGKRSIPILYEAVIAEENEYALRATALRLQHEVMVFEGWDVENPPVVRVFREGEYVYIDVSLTSPILDILEAEYTASEISEDRNKERIANEVLVSAAFDVAVAIASEIKSEETRRALRAGLDLWRSSNLFGERASVALSKLREDEGETGGRPYLGGLGFSMVAKMILQAALAGEIGRDVDEGVHRVIPHIAQDLKECADDAERDEYLENLVSEVTKLARLDRRADSERLISYTTEAYWMAFLGASAGVLDDDRVSFTPIRKQIEKLGHNDLSVRREAQEKICQFASDFGGRLARAGSLLRRQALLPTVFNLYDSDNYGALMEAARKTIEECNERGTTTPKNWHNAKLNAMSNMKEDLSETEAGLAAAGLKIAIKDILDSQPTDDNGIALKNRLMGIWKTTQNAIKTETAAAGIQMAEDDDTLYVLANDSARAMEIFFDEASAPVEIAKLNGQNTVDEAIAEAVKRADVKPARIVYLYNSEEYRTELKEVKGIGLNKRGIKSLPKSGAPLQDLLGALRIPIQANNLDAAAIAIQAKELELILTGA